jgi:hypothetical protein
MTVRMPPTLATWLLRHLGSGYHGESLEGDLFEEYQQGRGRLWYWKQTCVAICSARARSVRMAMPGFGAVAILRLLTEVAILLGITVLAGQSRQLCSLHSVLSPVFMLTLIAVLALAQSIGYYLSLQRSRRSSRQPRLSHAVTAFALSALSVGTLTWAGTTGKAQCVSQQCSCQGHPIPSGATSGSIPQRASISSGGDSK